MRPSSSFAEMVRVLWKDDDTAQEGGNEAARRIQGLLPLLQYRLLSKLPIYIYHIPVIRILTHVPLLGN
jgi:hypothetical protein